MEPTRLGKACALQADDLYVLPGDSTATHLIGPGQLVKPVLELVILDSLYSVDDCYCSYTLETHTCYQYHKHVM